MQQLLPKETPSSRLATAMGQGLNYAMQDMLQQKIETRKGRQLLEALGPDTLKAYGMDKSSIDHLAPLGPDLISAVMQMKGEQGTLKDYINAETDSFDDTRPKSIQSPTSPYENITQSPLAQSLTQKGSTLPPGTPPMLNADKMPQPTTETKPQTPIQKPISPKNQAYVLPEKTLSEMKKPIKQKWNDVIKNARKSGANRKNIEKLVSSRDKELEQTQKDYQAEAEMAKTKYIQSKDILERNEKSEDNALAYIKTLDESHRKNMAASQSLQGIIDLSKIAGDSSKWKIALSGYLDVPEDLFFSPAEDTIKKFSNNLLPAQMQQYAGVAGKIMKAEVDSMAGTIPNLSQTTEGRTTVAEYMKKSLELKEVERTVADQLYKEYMSKGEPIPKNFEHQVSMKSEQAAQEIVKQMHRIYLHQTGVPEGYLAFINPKGKRVALPEADFEEATNPKNGYKLSW